MIILNNVKLNNKYYAYNYLQLCHCHLLHRDPK